MLRCSSAREGEDEVEDGGGGTLLDVEPGKKTNKKQANTNKEQTQNKQTRNL